MSTKSNEWYTPSKYIEAARTVMGGIDLDPASCELANQTVKADRYYTKEENGLMQPWYGRVWLNPPYGRIHPENTGSTRSYQWIFAHRLLQAYIRGAVEQAIMLLYSNAVFQHWFVPLWVYPVCFVGRIEFFREDGIFQKSGFGHPLVYLGPHEQKFIETFSSFGTIAKRVSPPPDFYRQLELIS